MVVWLALADANVVSCELESVDAVSFVLGGVEVVPLAREVFMVVWIELVGANVVSVDI